MADAAVRPHEVSILTAAHIALGLWRGTSPALNTSMMRMSEPQHGHGLSGSGMAVISLVFSATLCWAGRAAPGLRRRSAYAAPCGRGGGHGCAAPELQPGDAGSRVGAHRLDDVRADRCPAQSPARAASRLTLRPPRADLVEIGEEIVPVNSRRRRRSALIRRPRLTSGDRSLRRRAVTIPRQSRGLSEDEPLEAAIGGATRPQ
jgi:hypothetical protein